MTDRMSQEKLDQPGPQIKRTAPDAVLQKYSLELLACIDEMRYKRDALHKQIQKDTVEKTKLQEDLKKLSDKLMKVNETICDKMVARSRFDQCITEAEDALKNLAVNSDNLVKFMKKVTSNILPEITSPRKEEEESPRTDEKKKKGRRSNSLKR